jgi:two-component system nitrogen regulation response regulator GlnG
LSRILVVDDEEAVCWALQRALTAEGHQVAVAASAEEAFLLADRQQPDAILLDVRLPGMDGLAALGRLRQLTHDAPVIVVTAFGTLHTAVQAVEGGAFDYLVKPFDLNQALDAVARALRRSRGSPPEELGGPEDAAEGIVGRSPAMQLVFKRIALVAPSQASVLITGESGTGKELVARAIHRHSPRRAQPFLPVHVAALNPNLVESELFGHEKGAFTGATQARAGLLSLANGGTLFLDELAEIPLAIQAKLLRVLENHEVVPVGGNRPQRLDVRILAATHQDLSHRIGKGQFRPDLFFRLNVFQIHLPPLRQRPEDILPLAEHFLRRFAPGALPIPPATVQYLESMPWLGNVRELRNALEHAAIVARGGPVLPEHFPTPAPGLPKDFDEHLMSTVKQWLANKIQEVGKGGPADLHAALLHLVESALLNEVLRRVQGNRLLAAQWLGLTRTTVRKKLQQYGLTDAHRPAASPESE